METAAATPRTLLRSLLKLRPGEEFRVGIMFLYSLVAIGGVYILGREVSRALFLTQLPEAATPYKFILPPFFIIVTTAVYTQIAPRYRLGRLIIGTSAVMITGIIFFRFLLGTSVGQSFTAMAALFVYFEIMINIVGIQFWTYAADIFNPREAKRVLGFVAAGGVVGGAVSGLGLRLLAPILPSEDIIYIVAVSLFLAMICVYLLERYTQSGETAVPLKRANASPNPSGHFHENLQAIIQSPLLLNIGGIVIISAMIKNIVAYQMDLSLQRFFTNDAQAMLTFLANFQIATSLIAILIQLFATNRILTKLGLIAGLLMLPAGVMFGSAAFLITGGAFWAMALPRGADIVFRFTTDDASINILFLPIPSDLRQRAKATLEGIIKQPMIALLGVLFLLFLRDDIVTTGVQAQDVVPWSLATIGLIVVWVLLVLRVRTQYAGALTASLVQRRLDLSNTEIDPSDETTARVLVDRLRQQDEMQVLNALTLIAQVPDQDWRPHVAPLLAHSALEVRVSAANYLAVDGRSLDESTAAAITLLLDDPEPAAQAAAIEALCASQGNDAISLVSPFLTSAETATRQAAIIGLIRHGGLDGMLHAVAALKEMLDSDTAVSRQAGAAILGQLQIQTFYQPLLALLNDTDTAVRISAVQAAGRVRHPDLLPHLVAALADEHVAGTAVSAIAAFGSDCIPALSAVMNDAATPIMVRLQIPAILRQLETPEAAALLRRHLSHDNKRLRAAVARALARLQSAGVRVDISENEVETAVMAEVHHYYRLIVVQTDLGPDGGGRLLRRALTEQMTATLDHLFDLLRLIYPQEAMLLVRESLRGSDARLRANGVELLDMIANRSLRSALLPLLEAPQADLLAIAGANYHLEPQTMPERLQALAAHPDPWLRACALFRIGELRLMELQPSITAALQDDAAIVRETAVVASRRLAATDVRLNHNNRPPKETTPMTLSTIERVFFLRGVELFSQVNSEDLVHVAQVCHETYFQPGEQFITQGDIGDSLYILIDGEAKVVIDGPGEIFYRVSRDILGEMSIISRKPRSAHCIAVTPVTALRIHHDDFWELMSAKPVLAQGVIKVLANRLDEVVAELGRSRPQPLIGETAVT